MRSVLLLALLLPTAATADAQCACGERLAEPGDALRAWEIATLDQRLHRRVDYPARLALLRAEIAAAEARVDVLESRLVEYRPFTRFRQGSPLNVTIQQTQLDLLREQQHLRDLRNRLADAHRRNADRSRLHALRVETAAARLAREHAAGEEPHIEIVTH